MRRKIIPYNPKLKLLAQELRKTMTKAEAILWSHLNQKKMLGYDFDRQRPINEYIVDFYCKDLMLAIEVDGITHDHPDAYVEDDIRQKRLESLGVNFLRFSDKEIKENKIGVLMTIEKWIEDHS